LGLTETSPKTRDVALKKKKKTKKKGEGKTENNPKSHPGKALTRSELTRTNAKGEVVSWKTVNMSTPT